jgi:hypothetical protein
MSSAYEPCVIGADGRCTRWSHDHNDSPSELARARRIWVRHLEHCGYCITAALERGAERCTLGKELRQHALTLGAEQRVRMAQRCQE